MLEKTKFVAPGAFSAMILTLLPTYTIRLHHSCRRRSAAIPAYVCVHRVSVGASQPWLLSPLLYLYVPGIFFSEQLVSLRCEIQSFLTLSAHIHNKTIFSCLQLVSEGEKGREKEKSNGGRETARTCSVSSRSL